MVETWLLAPALKKRGEAKDPEEILIQRLFIERERGAMVDTL